MGKWIMDYVKKSLLFKLGVLNLIWLFLSFIEVMFHNPYTPYTVFNYFDLIARSLEGERHTSEVLCTVLHVYYGLLLIASTLFFMLIKKKGLIDVYVFMMSVIILVITLSLITAHTNICMYAGLVLELLYTMGLCTEMSIDR